MKRKLVAILTMLVLFLTPFALVGCGGGATTMSFQDYQALELSAAQSFKNEHTEYETFGDVTYLGAGSTTTKNSVMLHYNQSADDDDYIDGVFEDKTVENYEYSLAIKKIDGALVAKLTNNVTVVEMENIVDEEDNFQHKQLTTTTVTQEVFYITTVTEEENTLNVVAYYKSTKVNDAAAVVTKNYETLNFAGLTDLIQNYALIYANARVARYFFEYAELLLYPGYYTTLTKTGNQVKYSYSYTYVDISANLSWGKSEVAGTVLFENNKVSKAESSMTNISEDSSVVSTSSLTIVNSATVEALDLDGYVETEGTINNYKNSSQSIIH